MVILLKISIIKVIGQLPEHDDVIRRVSLASDPVPARAGPDWVQDLQNTTILMFVEPY